MDIVLDEKSDIRIPSKKPEKFCYDSFPVDLLGGKKGETFFEFESELATKKTIGYISTSEILVVDTMLDEISTKIEILLFWVYRHRKLVRNYCQELYAR